MTNNRHGSEKPKVTMTTIARELGVTKVTVSKALNGQPGVSAELKQRITELARVQGYRPPKAVSNEDRRDFAFLLPEKFFPDQENYYTAIYSHLLRLLAEKGEGYLHLFVLENGAQGPLPFPSHIDLKTLAGIFIGGEVDKPVLESIVALHRPTVYIDQQATDLGIDGLVVDNLNSSFQVTRYLIDQGHRSIGFVGDPSYSHSVADRYYGYLKALSIGGLEQRPGWHLVNNDRNGIYTSNFALPDALPTAFVCHCDTAAHHLMLRLQRAGISVPQDVSLVSFDNTNLAELTSPRLTSVNIDKQLFARKALSQMQWRILNPDEAPHLEIISTSLVPRDSVASIPR